MKKKVESHPLSSLVRKVIDKTRYKKLVAANIMVAGVVFNTLSSPSHAFDYRVTSNLAVRPSEVAVSPKTETKFVNPVVMPIGVSQGYHTFHPGIDVRAPKGSPVVAALEGMVVEVSRSNVGYGYYVRMAHEGTVSTLYAHLNSVEVETGERVSKGKKVGTVGTTGWTTGPHLHFEIYEGTKPLNPASVIRF